ncbi:TetR/AcrR family transcriptional regulator [Haladaptatus pallidirubidus]|uniref:HTH tetR-type domain-containing protein n=1 Tax=Haladaptatus pallidirubidus TaxID=1008152 RepID=A0AAV3URH5_9EURY|nr:TetR/AcrR family transcriptional regulator [Haladaptatus pallidirubidus]
MPRFTDAKRERVRETLHETGRELFGRYGLRKTTLQELTEPAEIATGTFYHFYDSKEELYIEILKEYSREFAPRLLGNSFEEHDDPEDAIAAFLKLLTNEFESNSLIHQVIVEDEFDRIKAQYAEQKREAEREHDVAYLLPYIEQWYDDERVSGPDPEIIARAIESVAYITLHEDDIGEDHYPAVRDTLIAAVADGLTNEPDSAGDTHE